MNYEVQIRRAAELDIAEAQLWYESQRSGLGAQFHAELIQVIDRLSQTPFMYQVVYRDIRRAMVRRFPHLVWYRVPGAAVTILACTHGRQDPRKTISRFQ